MEIKIFGNRLAALRIQKGVSAREMSQSLDLSEGYISGIENGINYPSMARFFLICDYLNVTPTEFFDTDTKYPDHMKQLMEDLKRLDAKQLELIAALVQNMR